MKPLSEIESFGAVDADNDSLLTTCFEDHEAFQGVLRGARCLVLGRKGAGKTAIFKRLVTTRRPSYFSYGHTFTEYPWEHHQRQKRSGTPESEAYLHSWTYLILMSISKVFLNMDQSLPYESPDDNDHFERLRKIERFVVDSYGSRDPDLTEIFKPSNSLKIKPHFNIRLGLLDAGVTLDSLPLSDLPRFIAEVNQAISEHLLEVANPEHEYHICFDQLDLAFDPESADYKQRLIGLILAARQINTRARDAGKKIYISIFLRSDIYDVLQFEDKNKVTENDASRLEWDTDRTIHTLQELMEKRFSVLLGGGAHVNWEALFSGQQMTSRQRQYQYILARTYSRPRDMIKFCNEVLNAHGRRARADGLDDNIFTNDDIHAAKNEYSHYLLAEMDDELHKQLPNYKKYLEILKALGFYQFSKEEFENIFERRAAEFEIVETSRDVLRSLFRASIIGFRRTGGRSGGSEWVFSYLDPRSRFDEEATQLRIHYGLIESLDLRRAQRSGSVGPVGEPDFDEDD